MDQILLDFAIAFVMVTVTIVLFGWFLRTAAAASILRMVGMMSRARVDPGISTDTDPSIVAIMKGARRRCARCPNEGYCERWLAGEVEGPNTFCPNASVFQGLAESTG